MPNPPSNSNTPKSTRTQSSIFSFFSTPAKRTANTKAAYAKDSQDELLSQIDSSIDSDMLAEVEAAEREFGVSTRKRSATPSKRKHMAASGKPSINKDMMAVDSTSSDEEDNYDPPSADDDDADDDYDPASAATLVPGRSGANSRSRIVDDSEDDEDEDALGGEISDDLSEESPIRASKPQLARGRSGSQRGVQFKTPDLKRVKYSSVSTPSGSEGVPHMNMPGSPSGPRKSALLLQPPPTSEDSKRARTAKFAKKNEERYRWLEDVRDAQKLRPLEPGYDKRTLYIPDSAWSSFSPFERQYWEIKSKHWDTVVFFKKGKFYELYENDATIGHQEFDLRMTDRVNMRMAGVPESSFDHWVAQFLAKGHKVARVDQMESKLAKDMRERGSAKKSDSLVTRQLTSVLTLGTLVDPSLLTQDLATYCMAIVEATREPDSSGAVPASSFGVAFVDTSTAQFHVCTVSEDDADRSGLETLLVQTNPREVVFVRGGAGPGQRLGGALAAASLTKGSSMDEGGMLASPDAWDGMAGISQATWRTLKNTCGPNTEWIALAPRKEFWDVPTLKREIEGAAYFAGDGWPSALQQAADSDERFAFTAVGGLVSYLRTLKLDKDLVSLGNFSAYSPMQHSTALVLDGPTMSNLDLFSVSSEDGGGSAAVPKASSVEGTLFGLLDHASTAFGRRLLSRWTCHPLRHSAAINARLDAVEFLMADTDLSDMLQATLKGLSDIERGLSRIHSGRCKVPDFVAVLSGLKAMAALVSKIRSDCGDSAPARIQALLRSFPQITDILDEFSGSFDETLAVSEGRLLPFAGCDQPCDAVMETIASLEAWFANHLKENRQRFDCSSIVYKNMGKEHYQLEMPASIKVPSSYFRLSNTKAVNRYWSPELRVKVQEHAEALETKSLVLDSYQSRLYARFDKHYGSLMKAVAVAAELDCLLALSVASQSLGTPACRPSILESNGGAGGFVEFRQLRHPCVALSGNASEFVANDIVLGRRTGSLAADEASMVLLTGPNMGGKSTLLRQLCLGVILAQLGCYVPAESATILPVDRLFTRIGARDNLLAGRSTFMVEMAETSTILRYATPRSLVVLDELGRGTSTHDGEAVAYGALHALCSRLGCLGIFSTHYGLLAESLLNPPGASGAVEPHLRPMFMACAVNEEEHRVTFLYKLQDGIASKSHGMNVAAMAGVPISIVTRASAVAEEFECKVKSKQRRADAEPVDGAASDPAARVLPVTLQSDFANLLRMSGLETVNNAPGSRNEPTAEDVPVGGAHAARKANENQFWCCIVDHLQRAMAAAHN
ncbi:DNA mismatch repair protein msh6 [Coemansia sp. RSA 1813]|nr:DNA mismatch repair protein msh6 [Coemansia sp. RSA 487]KAJ2568948.1 DNA mismatch repair protein msh6 [Coemansia sp. RSA 1813]